MLTSRQYDVNNVNIAIESLLTSISKHRRREKCEADSHLSILNLLINSCHGENSPCMFKK